MRLILAVVCITGDNDATEERDGIPLGAALLAPRGGVGGGS
jgi:hypothetical protein